jgi:uncharacterized protein (TIGR02594 family)
MTRWLEVARKYEGEKEVKGKGSNARILGWIRNEGRGKWAKDDATPWCGAFMAAVFTEAGLASIVPEEPLVAANWRTVGVPLDGPKIGAIVVVPRHDPNNPNAAHVAIVAEFNEHTLWLLGGNQKDAVNVSTFRRLNADGTERGVYRWPVPIKTPKELEAEGSRIAARARRAARDTQISAGSGTSPQTAPAVVDKLPALPKTGLRETVDGLVGDVSWVKRTMETLADLAVFAGAKWPVLAVIVAAYFGGRVLWDTYLVREYRAQDANEGYST